MQKQDAPGLQSRMDPVPDCGETSYTGHERLKGRRALVTGGDSGIGRAVAVAFAREGAEVAINYLDEEQPDADSLAGLLKAEGSKLTMLPGDLRNVETCRRIVKEAYKRLGGLDILVLNAGVQQAAADIAEITPERVRRTFEVNVYAPLFMAQAAVPLLPPGASVIITASAEYYTPNKLLLDYAAGYQRRGGDFGDFVSYLSSLQELDSDLPSASPAAGAGESAAFSCFSPVCA